MAYNFWVLFPAFGLCFTICSCPWASDVPPLVLFFFWSVGFRRSPLRFGVVVGLGVTGCACGSKAKKKSPQSYTQSSPQSSPQSYPQSSPQSSPQSYPQYSPQPPPQSSPQSPQSSPQSPQPSLQSSPQSPQSLLLLCFCFALLCFA